MSSEPTQQMESRPAQEPQTSQPTEQLDELADASDARPGTEGASADGSLRQFVIGLLGLSLVVIIIASAIELAAG